MNVGNVKAESRLRARFSFQTFNRLELQSYELMIHHHHDHDLF